jgi:hypothetical protein
MTRWLSTVFTIAVGASAISCNTPVCGAGTKQVQNKDGSVQCVEVDAPQQTIKCDTEHGAVIQGGICTSVRTCDPATTTEINGVCVGTGGGGNGPPACPPPAAGTFCVNGLIHDLLDNAVHKARIHVAWYDPLDFLSGGAAKAELDTDTGGFVFRDQPPTGTGLIAIAVGDADRSNTVWVTAGSGAQNVRENKSYRVDGYAIPRTLVNTWNTQSSTDWVASGGYLARYFSDAKPPENNLAATEASPVMGVQLTQMGTVKVPPNAYYFTTDLSTLSATNTSTGAAGAALFKAVAINTYSGMGGGIAWETQQGGTAGGVIFVSRFHPN